MTFPIPYTYDYIMKFYRKQAVLKITKMQTFAILTEEKPDTEKYKRLKLGGWSSVRPF